MEISYCPIIRPTMKEFQNFSQFVQKLDQIYKEHYGIVKVIPPAEWKARKNDYSSALRDLRINGPIEQNLYGKGGIYQCLHIAKKSMSFQEYRQKSEELDQTVDGMSSQQVQDIFWKNIAFSPPLYGADLLNSLMETSAGGWDLKNLNSILNCCLSQPIKGVNSPYCYVGQWKALFCWHKQDLDLSAINYLHKGKSKFWYGIASNMGSLFEKQVSKLFPEHFSRCSQFLRHKTTLINPYLLLKKIPGFVIHKAEQKENQFILAFGGAYHCGFNFGFNLAEAVNYATLDWLNQLIGCKSCQCLKSSVKASPLQIYNNLLKSKQILGSIGPLVKTQQFLNFQSYIFKLIETEESEQSQDEYTMHVIKKQLTKKIKKNIKCSHLKKVTYKGECYKIDNWIQCENCKIWRIVNERCPSRSFTCSKVGKKCSMREKIPKNCITLTSTEAK